MSRLSTILKDSPLYKAIAKSFFNQDKTFGLSKGTTRAEITEALGHKTVKEFNNFLSDSPTSTKYLRVEELFIIIENLETSSQKIILDYICSKFGFICLDSASADDTNNSLETILLQLSSTNGELSKEFLESVKDGSINDYEREKLNSIAYMFRSLLRTFEMKIKGSEND